MVDMNAVEHEPETLIKLGLHGEPLVCRMVPDTSLLIEWIGFDPEFRSARHQCMAYIHTDGRVVAEKVFSKSMAPED